MVEEAGRERKILFRDDRMVAVLEKGLIVRVYFKATYGTSYIFDREPYRFFEQWYCQVKDLDPRHWDWDKYV